MNWKLFFFLLIATVFSILYQGYYYGLVDQGFFIAYLSKLNNPSLYPNDIMMNMLMDTFPGYSWKLIALVTPQINLEILLLFLHVVFRFLFFFSLFKLTYFITKNTEVAYLNALLWFTSKTKLGYVIFTNNFVQSQMVYPIIIYSIYLFFKSKYLWAYILLIMAFYIHQPISVSLIVIYSLVLLLKKDIRNLIKYSGIFLIGITPLLKNVTTITNKVGEYNSEWLSLMYIRNAHHILPSTWTITAWLPFFFMLIFVFVYYLFYYKKIKLDINKTLAVFIVVSLIGILVSIVFTQFYPIPRLLSIAPFHSSGIFTILGSVITAFVLLQLIRSKKMYISFAGFILTFFYFFNQFSLDVPRSVIVLLPIALGLYFIFRKKLKILFILYLIIAIVWLPYMYMKNQKPSNDYYKSWVEVQKWANKNTAKDSMFIVPVYLSSFRLYSERPIVVDWKDGGAGFYAPNYFEQWWERMKDIGIRSNMRDVPAQKIVYNSMSEDKIRYLFNKYDASYIVFEKREDISGFNQVFGNNYFVVYKNSPTYK